MTRALIAAALVATAIAAAPLAQATPTTDDLVCLYAQMGQSPEQIAETLVAGNPTLPLFRARHPLHGDQPGDPAGLHLLTRGLQASHDHMKLTRQLPGHGRKVRIVEHAGELDADGHITRAVIPLG
jgi:hypothetical protein